MHYWTARGVSLPTRMETSSTMRSQLSLPRYDIFLTFTEWRPPTLQLIILTMHSNLGSSIRNDSAPMRRGLQAKDGTQSKLTPNHYHDSLANNFPQHYVWTYAIRLRHTPDQNSPRRCGWGHVVGIRVWSVRQVVSNLAKNSRWAHRNSLYSTFKPFAVLIGTVTKDYSLDSSTLKMIMELFWSMKTEVLLTTEVWISKQNSESERTWE
jgi:hypothetical protein